MLNTCIDYIKANAPVLTFFVNGKYCTMSLVNTLTHLRTQEARIGAQLL